MPRKSWTSIPILPETRDDLKKKLKKGETYDEIIKRNMKIIK